jgi:hypothetical protein
MTDRTTTAEKVAQWEATSPLLNAMHTEFRDLSKKQPDGAVNKRKMSAANRLLGRCREVLDGELSLEFLDALDEDDVPQNSDVVLLLSQYVAAMKQFHSAYHRWLGTEHGWAIR